MTSSENRTQQRRSSKRWRKSSSWLLAFLAVLALEAAFNEGILLGRLRWKNDVAWVQPVFLVMSVTLLVLLWALYRQARRIMREYMDDSVGS